VRRKAPITAPQYRPMPPSATMSTRTTEKRKEKISGLMTVM
jgi:hypothetical protein